MTSSVNGETELRHWLVDYLVTTIGCNPEAIDPDLSLNELGVGSRDAVVLSGELSELLGRPVSPVEFWQHPTINALAAFLTTPDAETATDVEPAGVGRIASDEPVAVIGLGCRFPGGIDGPEALWQFLCDGRSAVGKVPLDRWQAFDDGSPETAAALAKTTRWGAFLSGLDAFDAEYFDISPSEAARIDPQQRLLLETASEALEHAGIPSSSLRRTQTGVFAGACVSEYGYLASRDLSRIDAWTGTGGALSIIANRLSYFLDLRGPSVAVDTACSSSLVAIHLACQSLRAGESQLAIAAGVNVLLSPAVTRSFDQADAMSPTGACHAFDAAADGFVRGEGCGVVVLKRLTDAKREGDRVLAVVRGSAVNQDGRSNGLMAPNPAAQMAVLRAACANAGIQPREVDYVEAHGTGTLLGDPIEARALGKVFGNGRPSSDPLLIGAVKTNLGHQEAAAGVAGFIKATLAVQRGRIPRNLHFESPNPHIPFDELRLKVVAEHQDWPETGRERRAGVSSFGFGGTNAHLVLEQAPNVAAAPAAPAAAAAVSTLVVSGKTPDRIAATALELADWMVGPGAGVALRDVAHTMNHHRSRHARFATVCAADREQAVEALRAVAAGSAAAGVVLPHAGPCGPGVVFVYSGQGSQWAGMGRRLLSEEPAFSAAVAELEPVFVEQVGFSLAEVLSGGMSVVGIDRVQPVLVGVQLALTDLWRSYGVEPDAVVGHSMGEVSAAVVAGALSVADGLRVIATRSRLMARLAGQGAMALLELDAAGAQEAIAGHPHVSVAVYASPRQTVIAGPPEQVDAVVAAVAGQDRLARRVEVDVASHHQIVDPILPELLSALDDLVPSAPTTPLISSTSSAPRGALFDARYWAANLRNPVRFSDAIVAAATEHSTFIEISPHPLLTHAITETLGDAHHHSLGTLQRDTHDTLTFHTNFNSTHTTQPPQTDHPPEPHTPLPTTPWLRTRHWITGGHRDDLRGSAPITGTLLGAHLVVSSTPAAHLWQARLLPEAKPYPGFHRLHGLEVVPVSVLLQTLLVAAAELGAPALSSLRFEHPITLDRPKLIQVFADTETLSISSSPAADGHAGRWTRHVTARLSRSVPDSTADPGILNGLASQRLLDAADPSSVDQLRPQGVEGQPFGWSVASYTSTSTGLDANVVLADESAEHPTVAMLDAATQLAALAGVTDSRLYLPAAVEQVWLQGAVTGPSGSISVRCTGLDADEVTVDIDAAGTEGIPGIALRSLRYVALEHEGEPAPESAADPRSFAHTIEWQPLLSETHGGTGTIAVIGAETPFTDELRVRLDSAGHSAGGVADARYVLYVADSPTVDDTDADIDIAARTSAHLTDLVRALADRADRDPVTLWVLTTGVHEAVGAAAVRQSPLWGLAGVIAAEHPEIWGGLVDLAPDHEIAQTATALAATLGTPSKTVVLLRDGTFLAPELVPVRGEPVREPVRCRPDVAYLITGGLGALGLLMAAWLADRGARRLLLAGRTPLPPRRNWDDPSRDAQTRQRITAIRDLERRGVSVEVVTLDIGSADQVRSLLTERDRLGAPPIRGIIHAAGVTGDQLVTSMSHDSMRRVMWPKVSGAQVLHEAFPCGSVDFFYLTASAGSIFGIPGQGSYAAANAYLDALARARHRDGCHTLSLDWAAWRGLGFASGAEVVAQELRRLGSRELEPDEAFAAWEYVDGRDLAQVVVVPTAAAAGEDLRRDADALPSAEAAAAWARLPLDDIREQLTAQIRTILARELRTAESELDTDRPFIELGLNSMMALSIRREIENIVGLELSATMLWNYPTVDALAVHLTAKLVGSQAPTAETMTVLGEPTESVLDSLFDRVESAPARRERRLR